MYRISHFSFFVETRYRTFASMTKYAKVKRSKTYNPWMMEKSRPALKRYGPERPIVMRSSRSLWQSYARGFPDIFPEKKYCRLVYAQQGVLTPAGAGQGALTTFRANSIFDPDLSGSGHQPKFHDILESVYERYAVEAATIEVTIWAPGSSSAGQMGAYVTLRPVSTDSVSVTLDNWEDLTENGSINIQPVGARDGGADIVKLRKTYNAKRMFGSRALNEDDNQALYGANPSKSPTFTVGVVPINSADTLGGVRYTVKLTYDVVSFRRKHDFGQD